MDETETPGTGSTIAAGGEKGAPQSQSRRGRLEEDTNLLLRNIPVGKMTSEDRGLARRVLTAWQRRHTPEGATMAELVLERLVTEQDAGSNRREEIVAAPAYNIVIDSWAKSGAEDCAQKAESILARMEERYQRYIDLKHEAGGGTYGFPPARPSTITYNSVLHALSRSPDTNAPARIEELIERMDELSSSDPRSMVRPDTTTYNCLINAYANRVGEYGTAQKAEDVLLRMSELSKDGGGDNAGSVSPDTRSFNIVMKAWLNSGEGGLESAKRAEQLLRLMAKLQRDGHDDVRPDSVSFSTCMRAYAKVKSGGDELVERVEGLLTLLEETGAAGDDVTACFDAAIDAIGQSEAADAGERAERIIERIFNLHASGTLNLVRPSSKTRARAMYAKARGMGAVNNAKAAEDLFHETIRIATANSEVGGVDGGASSSTLSPDAASFRALLKTILESNEDGAARRVDKLLNQLEQSAKDHQSLAPDTALYNMVIDAYSQSKEIGAAKNAFALLQRMEDSFASGNTKAKPVGFSYNSVIGQLRRCGEEGAEARAYEALTMMESQSKQGNPFVIPDTITYNVVIGMHAKLGTKDGAERALALLRRMETIAKSNDAVQPDCISIASVINAFTRIEHPRAANIALELFNMAKSMEESGLVVVDDVVYRSILAVLNKGGNPKFTHRAYDIFMEMNARYNKGCEAAKIDWTACANMVVGAYANSGLGPAGAKKAQAVLADLIAQHRGGNVPAMPDKIGFHSVIRAWMKSNDPAGIKHAEKLMRLMSELGQQGDADLEPDVKTITLLIQMLSRHGEKKGSAQRAQELFDMVDEESRHYSSSAPDKILYDSLLNVWAKSGEPDKHHRASNILQTMNDRYKEGSSKVEPDLVSHNIVLNSCAYATDEKVKKEALQVANEIFEQIQTSAHMNADSVTYGTMIKAIRNLSEDGDQELLLKTILSQCKSDGQLGNLVISSLPASCRWELLGVDKADHLPSDWTRNVKVKQQT